MFVSPEFDSQSKLKNQKSKMSWRKGQDSNLQGTSPVVFKTTALPVRLPFRKKSELCSLCFVPCFRASDQSAESENFRKLSTKAKYKVRFSFGACGRTRTYEVYDKRLIYSQVLLPLSHACGRRASSFVLGFFAEFTTTRQTKYEEQSTKYVFNGSTKPTALW